MMTMQVAIAGHLRDDEGVDTVMFADTLDGDESTFGLMRGGPGDPDEICVLADGVATTGPSLAEWSLEPGALRVVLESAAAESLGVDEELMFDLSTAQGVDEGLLTRLRDVLSVVPESR